jgi:peroxiredoxin
MNQFLRHCLPIAALLLLASCDKPQPGESSELLAPGFWQARITLPGGDIETGIELSRTPAGYTANLINGQERVPIDTVSIDNKRMLLRFSAFNNEIDAHVNKDRLVGELILTKRYGEKQTMPFVATPGAAKAETAAVTSDIDMSGRWAVQFHEEDGSNTPSIGEFSQRGSRLFGTFLNPNGDYRYLSGYVRGKKFTLSTFDGAHAFLFSGEINNNRITDAEFWSGTSWHQTWSAVRDPSVTLPDAYTRTWLKPGYERFEFAFPNLDEALVSINDQRFKGKVLVVMLAGTWCPNCHDEARFMAPLYDSLRQQGLEVVSLMYENFEDHATASQQVRAFRKKFNIKYDTLLAGISSKTEAADTLPSLNAVLAFPTTIFIDRSGRVRKIHTGFNGPGTGEHYKKLTTEITALIKELLAEPPNLIDSLHSESEHTG